MFIKNNNNNVNSNVVTWEPETATVQLDFVTTHRKHKDTALNEI